MRRIFINCKRFALLAASMLFVKSTIAQWVYTGGNITHNNAYAAHYSMATDSNGIPYVAFADQGNAYIVTVKKLEAGTWVNVGTPGFITGTGPGSALFYNPGIALAVNPADNSAWVALADGNHQNKLSVMRFNGTVWELVGTAGFTAESSCGAKLVFTSNGTPYVAYSACYNGAGISVMKLAPAGWEYAGPQNFAQGNYANLAVSANDVVSIAFQDLSNAGKISVRYLSSGNWLAVGPAGFSDGQIENLNIASDTANNLYVCYTDYSLGSKLIVKKFVSPSWQNLGSGAVSQFTSRNPDISINRFGVPYVSYVDGSLPVVKKFVNNSWTKLGNYVAAGTSYHTTIFNDSLGNPWVLTSLQPTVTLPFLLKYKPCMDPDYNFDASVVIDSAITQNGGSTTLTVSASGGMPPYAGTGTYSVFSGYYTYIVTDANGCADTLNISVPEPQPECTDNYWLGISSTDWTDISNWSCGSLPGLSTKVYVEPGATYYPVITTAITCREAVVAPGVSITVAAAGSLTLVGQ